MLPIRWSLLSEFFSLLLLIIICTHYFGYERNTAFTGRRKLFLCCLLSAMGSIILNIRGFVHNRGWTNPPEGPKCCS